MVRSFDALPQQPIEALGTLSQACLDHGARDFPTLGRLLRDLPYGRTADRSNYAGVLAAARGTCSSKHAFLAATAQEQDVPIELMLGLYEMSDANTPGVGEALAAGELSRVPEAHCYVRHAGTRIDVTRAATEPTEPITFLHEEAIRPEQIGDYKVRWHQHHLQAWCDSRGHDWREIWKIREQCISDLAAPQPEPNS